MSKGARSATCLLLVIEPVKHLMDFNLLSDDDYERLARYVSGEASAHERTEIERWVADVAERRSALDALQAAWTATAAAPEWNVERAWARVSSRLHEAPVSPQIVANVVSIASRRDWWRGTDRLMQFAAAAVLLVGGALLYPKLRGATPVGTSAGTTAGTTPVPGTEVAITTAAGQRRMIDLPDGSRVTLGVASSLRARPGYGNGVREVELTGEAMFVVTHDESRPFRVYVGSSVVEDLGTEFAIRAYAGEPALRVAVAAGSVSVRRGISSASPVRLSPRDVATVRDTGSIGVTHDVDVAKFTAFASGRLIFVDTPLSDVASDLSRWYGVEVRITDTSLLGRHLTSTFEAESLDEVLRIIGLALDVKYLRNGQAVEFSGSGAMSGAAPPRPLRSEAGA